MSTQKQLIEVLIRKVESLEDNLPNGNIVKIQEFISEMRQTQGEMKDDIRKLRKTILDPEGGLVVRINKNTEWRKEDKIFREERVPFYDSKVFEFESLKNWKKSVSKALWVLYSAIIGVIIKLLFF